MPSAAAVQICLLLLFCVDISEVLLASLAIASAGRSEQPPDLTQMGITWCNPSSSAEPVVVQFQFALLGVLCCLCLVLQSYYEEQKREQMQGPALKRLEEEQQQHTQTPPLVPLHSAGCLRSDDPQQQSQLPDFSADDAEEDSGELQPSALQLSNARSWLGGNRQLPHHQDGSQPRFSGGQPHLMIGAATSLGNGIRMPRPFHSPKPPLPSRPRGQISSEMSFLGGSAGSSGTAASFDSNT